MGALARHQRSHGTEKRCMVLLRLVAALLACLAFAVPAAALPTVSSHSASCVSACGKFIAPPMDRDVAALPPRAGRIGIISWYGIASPFAATLSPVGELRAAVAPIPLPAAGWLLIAGLGALGLCRRRSDCSASLRSVLLESARSDLVRPVGCVRSSPEEAWTSAACMNSVRSERLISAFSPGLASPTRPVGGAGMLYGATAERGPPEDPSWAPAPMVAYLFEKRGVRRCRAQERSSGPASRFSSFWRSGPPPGDNQGKRPVVDRLPSALTESADAVRLWVPQGPSKLGRIIKPMGACYASLD
jgi:hypothetical protein